MLLSQPFFYSTCIRTKNSILGQHGPVYEREKCKIDAHWIVNEGPHKVEFLTRALISKRGPSFLNEGPHSERAIIGLQWSRGQNN